MPCPRKITRGMVGTISHCNNFGLPKFHCVVGNFVQHARLVITSRSQSGFFRCRAPLVKALLDGAYAVEHCERCRGILLPRAAFAEAVTRRRARQSGAPAPPVPMDPRELKHVVVCPSCRSQMDVHPYYGPGNVVIDSCQRCDLIWLDFGELTQITEAGGRDRGWRVSSS